MIKTIFNLFFIVDLPKIESLAGGGGVQNVLLERGDKPEKKALPLFYYFTVQFNHIYSVCVCVGGGGGEGGGGRVRFPLYLSDLQSFELAFCTFPIHSGSLHKMLTALFNLVWNTQKSKWTILFECQGKMFLSIEKVLEKISEDQP